MKLGVNSNVNADGTKEVGIRHNLGVSEAKLPHVVHKDMSKELRKAADKIESIDDKTIPKTEKNTHTT